MITEQYRPPQISAEHHFKLLINFFCVCISGQYCGFPCYGGDFLCVVIILFRGCVVDYVKGDCVICAVGLDSYVESVVIAKLTEDNCGYCGDVCLGHDQLWCVMCYADYQYEGVK